MKTAVIFGVTGQDGSYLTDLLLSENYKVIGVARRSSVDTTERIDRHEKNNSFLLVEGDITDGFCVSDIINKYQPDEVYNLAAQSHVRISFDQPVFTGNVTGLGTLNLLEAIRIINPKIKVYQASSSEMFGNSIDSDGYQRETTPLIPVSPYGCAKVYSYNICNNYKNSYNMFISNGILFNHESPRRGINFVTNKVVKSAVDIKNGLIDTLPMGNLNATRDWGHAKDYVKAMWLMLQQDKPDNFVCATGISHSVEELIKYVFGKIGIDWTEYITQDEKFLRPEELTDLKGDSSKARKELNWESKYTFETMLDEMIEFWT